MQTQIVIPTCDHKTSKTELIFNAEIKTSHKHIMKNITVSVPLCFSCMENLVNDLQRVIVPDWVEVQHEGEYK